MHVWGLRKWFMASAERLLLDGYDLMQRKLSGYLLWRFGSQWKKPYMGEPQGDCKRSYLNYELW